MILTNDFSYAPFAEWLEAVVKEMFDISPTAISMQMLDADGKIYTCYWNVSEDARAILIDALQDDARFDWVRNNKEAILEILNGEDGDDDELCDDDTEADSTG